MWLLTVDIPGSLVQLQSLFVNNMPTVAPMPARSTSHVGLVLGLLFGLFLPLVLIAAASFWFYQRRRNSEEMLERQSFAGRG